MSKDYLIVRGPVVTNDGFGRQTGTIVNSDSLAPSELAALVKDGSVVPCGPGDDTGWPSSKDPRAADVGETAQTKVIAPEVRKGGRR